MTDPNSTTEPNFHKNFSLGGHYFRGILIPWTKFFRTKIPPTDHYLHVAYIALAVKGRQMNLPRANFNELQIWLTWLCETKNKL